MMGEWGGGNRERERWGGEERSETDNEFAVRMKYDCKCACREALLAARRGPNPDPIWFLCVNYAAGKSLS